jgi:hypothetical protein
MKNYLRRGPSGRAPGKTGVRFANVLTLSQTQSNSVKLSQTQSNSVKLSQTQSNQVKVLPEGRQAKTDKNKVIQANQG